MTYRTLAALLLFVLLAACGQSGPLYIPGNPSKIEAPPPTAEEPADDEQTEESREEDK